MLRALYVIAIGLLFAAFIGFGVATFYQSPASPYETGVIKTEVPNTVPTEAELAQQRQTEDNFQLESQKYERNLSLIFLAAAVLVIMVSIFGLGKVNIIGDGITLGGVFLLFAGIVTSFGSADEIFRFIAVTIGLVVIIFLSYWKFVRHADANLA